MKITSSRFVNVTAAIAAVTVLFACSMIDGAVGTDAGASREIGEVVAKVQKGMGSMSSYRVDGTITTFQPGDPEGKSITLRGDWVRPDRLEWNISGLQNDRIEYFVIVGDRAYHRDRRISSRDWSNWVETDAGLVDSSYTGGLLQLTMGLDEYLSEISWTSAVAEPQDSIRLKGILSENVNEPGGFVKYYEIKVRKVGPLPIIKTKHLIKELTIQIIDHSGPHPLLVQEARYKFTLFFYPLEVVSPLP